METWPNIRCFRNWDVSFWYAFLMQKIFFHPIFLLTSRRFEVGEARYDPYSLRQKAFELHSLFMNLLVQARAWMSLSSRCEQTANKAASGRQVKMSWHPVTILSMCENISRPNALFTSPWTQKIYAKHEIFIVPNCLIPNKHYCNNELL